jgi:hypothetical protein
MGDTDTESRRLLTQQSIDASNRPATTNRQATTGRVEFTGGETVLLDEIRAIAKHLDIIDVQLPVQRQWIEAMQALREPLDRLEKGLHDGSSLDLQAFSEVLGEHLGEQKSTLREIRGQLAGIRTRLDSLVWIQKELGYQGQRIAAVERRLTTLVETKLDPA